MNLPFTKSYRSMSKTELQQAADLLNLNTEGTMEAIRTRIESHITDEGILHTLINDADYTRLFPTRFRNNYRPPDTVPEPETYSVWGGIQSPSERSPPAPSNFDPDTPPSPPQSTITSAGHSSSIQPSSSASTLVRHTSPSGELLFPTNPHNFLHPSTTERLHCEFLRMLLLYVLKCYYHMR